MKNDIQIFCPYCDKGKCTAFNEGKDNCKDMNRDCLYKRQHLPEINEIMVSSFKLDSDSERLKIEIEEIENTNKHDDFAGALIPYSLDDVKNMQNSESKIYKDVILQKNRKDISELKKAIYDNN